MCLLFYYLNDNATRDTYRLVLGNIRDESWDRPTLPSGFWIDNPSCIGGIDLQAGRGGTWLAMNREGKLAILLNILMNHPETNKLPRGALVSDYVKNSERNIDQYIDEIAQKGDQYNQFNLILFDLKLKSTCYYSNEMKGNKPEKLKEGIYGFSNTEMTKPWKKVIAGKEIFENAVAQFPNVKDKESLQTALFNLMANEERYYDADADIKFPGKDYITSYITCRSTDDRYGSRCLDQGDKGIVPCLFLKRFRPFCDHHQGTHSVILIDGDGNCDFLEKTLQTPVVADNYKWEFSNHSFRLNLN